MGIFLNRVGPILEAAADRIVAHPFVEGIIDGTLPPDAFGRYLTQNFLYLAGYARASAVLAARSIESDDVLFYSRRSTYTIESEQGLARELMSELGFDYASPENSSPSPICMSYSSFIKQAAAYEPVPVAQAAMLPCYVLYNEVSRRLAETGSPNPSYQRWLDMYVGEKFEEGVRGAKDRVDRSAEQASPELLDRMIDHIRMACGFEWLFWDAAFHGIGWPD